ncbi:MAG: aminoacyl-tRNA hydrolase [Phycisphaerales bacterium]|jgi:PTH1 family peptidyl-tRNA hydrolase|nr:aminoacyl-tRNA hydrolase [Phycisphaerales bacterium]MDP6890390.1 aminoacyl-tRNA hydrolase [Phycisphaerales bacterium]
MRLVVGIGNPGTEFDCTRHNVGFEAIDRLARRIAPGEIARSKFQGAMLESTLTDDKVLLLKPTTFVNRSGQAVSEAIRFYKLAPEEDLLVLVDDTALPCGRIRVRESGGTGGHNGLQDITSHLGTDRWARVRIGIDGPGTIPLSSYVLGRFRPDQQDEAERGIEQAVEAADCWIHRGVTAAMNAFNADREPNGSPEETP